MLERNNCVCVDSVQIITHHFQILQDPFFDGYCPSNLPISSLTTVPRFPDMPVGSVTAGSRKPLAECNRWPADGILRSIPEGKKPDPLTNVSRAVCVKDGVGHDVVEDPEMETDGKFFDWSLKAFKSFNNRQENADGLN